MSETGLLIPAEVAQRLNARTEVCGNCKWRVKPNQTSDIECRAHPPTASLNLVPTATNVQRPGMQAMGLQPFSLFPLVNDDMWCGEWAPRMPQ